MTKRKRARYVRGDRWSRFWDKVQLGPVNSWRPDLGPCWLWTAATYNGYGAFSHRPGRTIAAHRWSFLALRGGCPPGLHLDHLCATRNCVNPTHLEPVENAENVRRQMARHKALGTFWRARVVYTHCKRGHESTLENTIKDGRGRRSCRICKNARKRAAYTPRPACPVGHLYATDVIPCRHRRCVECHPTTTERKAAVA